MNVDEACEAILKHGYDIHLQRDGNEYTAWTRDNQEAPSADTPTRAILALAESFGIKEVSS